MLVHKIYIFMYINAYIYACDIGGEKETTCWDEHFNILISSCLKEVKTIPYGSLVFVQIDAFFYTLWPVST